MLCSTVVAIFAVLVLKRDASAVSKKTTLNLFLFIFLLHFFSFLKKERKIHERTCDKLLPPDVSGKITNIYLSFYLVVCFRNRNGIGLGNTMGLPRKKLNMGNKVEKNQALVFSIKWWTKRAKEKKQRSIWNRSSSSSLSTALAATLCLIYQPGASMVQCVCVCVLQLWVGDH